MKIGLVIPAAGSGNRMGASKNKLFLQVNHKTIIEYTVETFTELELVDEIVLVIKEEERETFDEYFKHNDKVSYACGGNDRTTSVKNGVFALSKDIDYILIHDGARPLVDPITINNVIDALSCHDAVIPAIPVKDTIKRVREGIVSETLVRSQLMAVQTPQGFKRSLLEEVYAHHNLSTWLVTDEASLIENYGKEVSVVEGNEKNIKVTTPIDIKMMEILLEDQNV